MEGMAAGTDDQGRVRASRARWAACGLPGAADSDFGVAIGPPSNGGPRSRAEGSGKIVACRVLRRSPGSVAVCCPAQLATSGRGI